MVSLVSLIDWNLEWKRKPNLICRKQKRCLPFVLFSKNQSFIYQIRQRGIKSSSHRFHDMIYLCFIKLMNEKYMHAKIYFVYYEKFAYIIIRKWPTEIKSFKRQIGFLFFVGRFSPSYTHTHTHTRQIWIYMFRRNEFEKENIRKYSVLLSKTMIKTVLQV